MKFDIRLYRAGDEEKINETFNEVFQQKREISHWYWKYRDNPYGSYIISLAVSEEGTVAAQYAGYPVMLYSLPEPRSVPAEFLTYQIGDKMTRKEFRSVGIGKSSLLARAFFLFREVFGHERGVRFAYGFTAHHSRRFGLLLLNYADVEPVPYRRLDLKTAHPFRKNRLKQLFAPITVLEASSIDDEWSDFFSLVAPGYSLLVRRDAHYLKWRYLARPDKSYLVLEVRRGSKMAGWSVFSREGRSIRWGDALFRPGDLDAVKAVLTHALGHPRFEGADCIEGWFANRPSWWGEILQSLGFGEEAEPNGLHLTPPIFTGAPAMEEITEEMKNGFYYTLGDSDLF